MLSSLKTGMVPLVYIIPLCVASGYCVSGAWDWVLGLREDFLRRLGLRFGISDPGV